jgi:hypothetical protein
MKISVRWNLPLQREGAIAEKSPLAEVTIFMDCRSVFSFFSCRQAGERAESAADSNTMWITKSPQGDRKSFNILDQNDRYLDLLLKN